MEEDGKKIDCFIDWMVNKPGRRKRRNNYEYEKEETKNVEGEDEAGQT